MKIDKQAKAMEARKNCGRYFRVMLRDVKPEHVPDMIHTLWLFGQSGKKIKVPEKGWRMKMPHGYALVGEGPVGMRIEPPPGPEVGRVDPPHNGAQAEENQPTPLGPRLDEHDTQGVVALCERARQFVRPERDQVILQIFSLKLDRCRPKALDAIEMLLYDLIAGDMA